MPSVFFPSRNGVIMPSKSRTAFSGGGVPVVLDREPSVKEPMIRGAGHTNNVGGIRPSRKSQQMQTQVEPKSLAGVHKIQAPPVNGGGGYMRKSTPSDDIKVPRSLKGRKKKRNNIKLVF